MRSRNTGAAATRGGARAAIAALAALLAPAAAPAQQVWTGYDLTFEKPSGADWTLPEHQDRISDTVWITRAEFAGVFNIFSETAYLTDVSPAGTEWAFGTTADWDSLTFAPWQITVQSFPPGMVGQPMVVHLIDDDVYLDLMFTSWEAGPGGGAGGFSYVRAIPSPATALASAPLIAAGLQRRRRRRG